MNTRVRSFISLIALATVVAAIPFTSNAQDKASRASRSPSEAPAAVLYSHNQMQTGTADGANGANTSSIATTPPAFNLFGSGINGTGTPDVILGDRFTLTGGASTISSIVFYAYSTAAAGAYGNPPAVPFTSAIVNIWNGQPGSGGTIIATSSTFGGSAWTGMYRVTTTTLTNSQRPIFSVQTNFPNTPLPAGNYWATCTITGIVAPGVAGSGFSPPVTNANLTLPSAYPNGGAPASVQSVDGGTTWTLPVDTGSNTRVFVPIVVNGTITLAAGVNVSGRVFSGSDGRGLTNATITLTDQTGQTVATARSGRIGNFEFPDVPLGTYVLNVSSRRFSFSPRVIEVVDSISGLDLYPDGGDMKGKP